MANILLTLHISKKETTSYPKHLYDPAERQEMQFFFAKSYFHISNIFLKKCDNQ